MQVSPYLFFNGCCEQAIDFYKKTLGAEVVMVMRFADAPPPDGPKMSLPAGSETKIMHAALKIGTTDVMASDGMCSGGKPSFQGMSLSLTVPDVAAADRIFEALAAEGEVRQPLTETFFAPRFGVVADKFGVGWMVVAQA